MEQQAQRLKKAISPETFVSIALFGGLAALFILNMGFVNTLSTVMQTAYHLLTDTVFFLTAIAVIAGALSGLMQEFGVIALIDRLLTPLMRPLFGMPGAASIGAITTYMSDNPAILALAADRNYLSYFKKYQVPALTNLGTGFGMGAIITTYVLGLSAVTGQNYLPAALIGNLGAIIGSLISTRLMLRFTRRIYGASGQAVDGGGQTLSRTHRVIRQGSAASRCLEAMLDGTIPPEMHEKYITIVLNETERLTKLTNSLLTLNNLNTKGMLLDKTDFDINQVIRNTASTFEGTCHNKSIAIEMILTGNEMYVHADMGKIQQVLYNLMDNAIKFSHHDSVIHIETSEKKNKLFVSVKDTGIGIPKEDLKLIWDRFYKSDLSRGKDKKGTGLGLSIVKEIINAHNEHINVISTPGVGSEFIFSLPKSHQEDEED